MSLQSLLYDPLFLRIALLSLGIVLGLAAYLLHRRRSRHGRMEDIPIAGAAAEDSPGEEPISQLQGHGAAPPPSPLPAIPLSPPGPFFAGEILRGMLIIIALVVGAGFAVILLPQETLDDMAISLRLRSAAAPLQETIAFLYLGDEVKGSEFHIRGVVRNITTQPIEQLDASIRLYAADRTLLETAVVRMDSESIPPDATAMFHLTYPDYRGQFGSYSIDFKLRQGDLVPYKDMRRARGEN